MKLIPSHCKSGHPLTTKNIRLRKDRPGIWDCRTCESERYRDKYRRSADFRAYVKAKNERLRSKVTVEHDL